jgi:hypothetical protein
MPKSTTVLDPEFQVFRRDLRHKEGRAREQAMQDLLHFALRDLAHFEPVDWQNARRLLHGLHAQAWLHPGNVLPPSDRVVPQVSASRELIRDVHGKIGEGLATLFPAEGGNLAWREWRLPLQSHDHVLVSYHGRLDRFMVANWPDTVWVAITRLFEEFGQLIRRCSVCESHRFFLRHRRQEYCSVACSQRVRSARWYRANRAKARKRRRQRYAKVKR